MEALSIPRLFTKTEMSMAEADTNIQLAKSPESAPTTSKLRDSCHACALSKVKCHKQKPTCSRCARRGIVCEYFQSRRPGRKKESHHSLTSNDDAMNVDGPVTSNNQSQCTDAVACNNVSEANDYLTPLLTPLNMPSISQGSNSTSFISSDLLLFGLSNTPGPELSPGVLGLNSNFDDLFASPTDFTDLDMLGPVYNFPSDSSNIADLLIPEESNFPEDVIPSTKRISDASHISSSTASSNQDFFINHSGPPVPLDAACCCLTKALDLLKNLSAGPSRESSAPPYSSENGRPPSRAFLDNKEASPFSRWPCSRFSHVMRLQHGRRPPR
ncbi:hypothetical protein BDV96DRAFT_164435 [Lophiotrema nucula]|uniref:Zn(2)-C6 fungal-type domain-containing protein n=1 Tax=Lophiotrema nucula TaxID=690887 RepID=A0A6A5Z0W1_9PLEO|nr:hypothetical protein BDV96DRAFT_164435 [Lophiotrema nucula]